MKLVLHTDKIGSPLREKIQSEITRKERETVLYTTMKFRNHKDIL